MFRIIRSINNIVYRCIRKNLFSRRFQLGDSKSIARFGILQKRRCCSQLTKIKHKLDVTYKNVYILKSMKFFKHSHRVVRIKVII